MRKLGPAAVRAVDVLRPAGLEGFGFGDLVRELIHRLDGVDEDRAKIRLLGELEHAMEPVLARGANRYASSHLQELLGTSLFWHRELGVGVEGETFLELGAGSENPLALATAMHLLGASRAYGLEMSPLLAEDRQAKAIARILYWLSLRRDLFTKFDLAPFAARIAQQAQVYDLARLSAGDLQLPEAVALLQASAAATGLPAASVDRVTSSSFLEHPDEPAAVVAEISRITRPGGLSIHNIDTVDHGVYGGATDSPVSFLLEAEGASMVRDCNRLRIFEFVRLFEDHGFELLKRTDYHEHRWTEQELARRVQPFAGMSRQELAPLRSVLVFRRQGAAT